MLHEKAVKKVEKALGVKVEKMGNRYGCIYNGHVISWISSSSRDEPHQLEAWNWHVRREDDHSDSMVDYFAGYHLANVTQLIHSVKKPEAKFPVGSLVRGKNNKRATRQGYAGRLAIVTKAGFYMNLKWTDSNEDRYRVTYPERDFEKA